ncbi:uncharacterized protein VP01_388g11 [Puccinia sorghi]|uniref:CCHC-type domain-containing protein n=1 Tax=Puccinia sorghi TaxID=27349 RepID=A0A0L6UST2_9BASI|nr:uncharacterized protein VP01_388g11 [Puccinia sorghi]
MDTLNTCLDKMMYMLAEECAQQLATDNAASRWSLTNSSTISSLVSLTTITNTLLKLPYDLSAKLEQWQTLPHPPASSSAPTTDPNAMDLLAFQRGQNRLSDTKQARQVQLNLCFCCGHTGHVSCGCSNGSRKLQGHQKSLSSAWISELQAKINRI